MEQQQTIFQYWFGQLWQIISSKMSFKTKLAVAIVFVFLAVLAVVFIFAKIESDRAKTGGPDFVKSPTVDYSPDQRAFSCIAKEEVCKPCLEKCL